MFELAAHSQTQPHAGMFGFAGLGAFAGAEDPNSVLVGTQLRLQGNIQNRVGIDPYTVSDVMLESVARSMQSRSYRILRRWFDYNGGIGLDVEVRTEKTNVEAVRDIDFFNALSDGLRSYELYPYNVRVDLPPLFNPRTQQQQQPPQTVPPVTTTTPPPPGSNPTTTDPNKQKTFFESLQDFFDKKFGFLGGTVSGAALIAIGVGAFFFLKRD